MQKQLVILKIWKLINDQQKFASNLLLYTNGSFLTLEAQKTLKQILSKNC